MQDAKNRLFSVNHTTHFRHTNKHNRPASHSQSSVFTHSSPIGQCTTHTPITARYFNPCSPQKALFQSAHKPSMMYAAKAKTSRPSGLFRGMYSNNYPNSFLFSRLFLTATPPPNPPTRPGPKVCKRRACRAWMGARLPFRNTHQQGKLSPSWDSRATVPLTRMAGLLSTCKQFMRSRAWRPRSSVLSSSYPSASLLPSPNTS